MESDKMENVGLPAKKYSVLVERKGRMCIPRDYHEQWGYDAVLLHANIEVHGYYRTTYEKVKFLTMHVENLDGHLLLQAAALEDLYKCDFAGCLSHYHPFGIICVPQDDPLRAIIPADKKMHAELEKIIHFFMQRWYEATPADIEILQE